jgi:ABC-type transport system involved in cytochrome bd biosynthesis fused ATPase/permease subunit
VLVLDEPTEHIDWATASALLVDLLEANRARTVLPITHRHVRGDRLDMVLRLADGRLST